MPQHVGPYPHVSGEAYALFEELRRFLYRLPEGHPSRPGLHTAAVTAYCHWCESSAPSIADATDRIACGDDE